MSARSHRSFISVNTYGVEVGHKVKVLSTRCVELRNDTEGGKSLATTSDQYKLEMRGSH